LHCFCLCLSFLFSFLVLSVLRACPFFVVFVWGYLRAGGKALESWHWEWVTGPLLLLFDLVHG
jgi:hypothetical protein